MRILPLLRNPDCTRSGRTVRVIDHITIPICETNLRNTIFRSIGIILFNFNPDLIMVYNPHILNPSTRSNTIRLKSLRNQRVIYHSAIIVGITSWHIQVKLGSCICLNNFSYRRNDLISGCVFCRDIECLRCISIKLNRSSSIVQLIVVGIWEYVVLRIWHHIQCRWRLLVERLEYHIYGIYILLVITGKMGIEPVILVHIGAFHRSATIGRFAQEAPSTFGIINCWRDSIKRVVPDVTLQFESVLSSMNNRQILPPPNRFRVRRSRISRYGIIRH